MAEKFWEIWEVKQWNIESVQVPQNSPRLSRQDTLKLAWQVLREPLDPKKWWISIVEIRTKWHELNEKRWVGNEKFDKQLWQTWPWYYEQMMDRRHPDINK